MPNFQTVCKKRTCSTCRITKLHTDMNVFYLPDCPIARTQIIYSMFQIAILHAQMYTFHMPKCLTREKHIFYMADYH